AARETSDLKPLINFLCDNIRNPRFARTLNDVASLLCDAYGLGARDDKTQDEQPATISGRFNGGVGPTSATLNNPIMVKLFESLRATMAHELDVLQAIPTTVGLLNSI